MPRHAETYGRNFSLGPQGDRRAGGLGHGGDGRVLRATSGPLDRHPTPYRYQWQDCASSGTSCATFAGATREQVHGAGGDAGHTIEAVVTARMRTAPRARGAHIVPLIDEFSGTSVDRNVWAVPDQQGDTSNDEQECYEPSQVPRARGR